MNRKFILLIALLIVLIIFISLIFLHENSEKLICTSSAESNGNRIEQKYIIKYLNENIDSIKVTKSYDFEKREQFDNFNLIIESTNSTIKGMNKKYINFKVSTSDKKYETFLDVDMENITEDELSILGLKKNFTEMQTLLEEQGLTCN